jgi:hypothetical protein
MPCTTVGRHCHSLLIKAASAPVRDSCESVSGEFEAQRGNRGKKRL